MAHACTVCNFYPVPDGDGVECPHCHRLQYGLSCPQCHANAPTIVRGLRVYCSACGFERGPLTATMPVNLAGRPSQVASTVSRVAGILALIATVLTALVLGLLVGMFSASAGLVVGLLVTLFGGATGAALLGGSSRLKKLGDAAQKGARESAVFALAANRGGVLTAADVATQLNVHIAEADALLTGLAREAGRVSVEVDAHGTVFYVFREVQVHTAPGSAAPSGVRVDASAPAAKTPEEHAREQVDREFEQMRATRGKIPPGGA